ncbi:MAG: hypothetical protein WC841_05745 [Candidatus Shapirobacteria bacterium]|jgi:hypothetical protein
MKKDILSLLSVFSLAVLTLSFSPPISFAQSYTSRQRIGVGVHSHTPVDYLNWYDFQAYNLGWYFTWKGTSDLPNPGNIDGVEFMPTYYNGKCPQASLDLVKNNPTAYPFGTTFLIGNELGMTEIPDMAVYAQDYRNCYLALKNLNRNYKVVLGALTSSSRIYMLETIRSEYKKNYGTDLPTDGYRVNVYFETLASAVTKMRNFMKSVGDQDKDLIITESCHPDKTESENVAYLKEALNYTTTTKDTSIGKPSDNYMLIQRFAWFLMNSAVNGYSSCSLYDINLHAAAYPPLKTKKTQVGLAFSDWMAKNIPPTASSPTPTKKPTLIPTLRPTSTTIPTIRPTSTSTSRPTSTSIPTIRPTPTLKPTSLPSASPTVSVCSKKATGDANCDGLVNIFDFGIWKVDFIDYRSGTKKNIWDSDFDVDSKVSIYDFSIWKLGYGK